MNSNSPQQIRIAGRTVIAIGADGTTTKCLAPIGAPASTVSAYTLDLVSTVFSSRPKALAAFYERWRLNAIRFEFTQIASVSNAFALGVVEDGAANPTSPSYSTIVEMQSSRAFNTGSGLKQDFIYRPSYNRDWLYTDAVSESTAAAVRLVSYGEVWGAWLTAPATSTYGSLTVHWDLSFRSPCPSETVTLKLEKVIQDSRPIIAGQAKTGAGSERPTRLDKDQEKGYCTVVYDDQYYRGAEETLRLQGPPRQPPPSIQIPRPTATPSVSCRPL